MARIQQPRRQQIRSAWGNQGVSAGQGKNRVGIGGAKRVSTPRMTASFSPKPSPSPPPSPSPARAAAPAVMPWDTDHERITGDARTVRDKSLAAVGVKRGAIRRAYGLDEGYRDNPGSQAVALQRSYEQGRSGQRNSLAAQGQFLSGAANRAMREGDINYANSKDALARRQEMDLAELTAQEAGIHGNYARQIAEADWARTMAAAQSPAVSAPVQPGAGGSGGGGGGGGGASSQRDRIAAITEPGPSLAQRWAALSPQQRLNRFRNANPQQRQRILAALGPQQRQALRKALGR